MQTPPAARWYSSGRNSPARQDVSGGHFHARTTYGHVRNSPESINPRRVASEQQITPTAGRGRAYNRPETRAGE